MFLPVGCIINLFTIKMQIEKTKEYCLYEVSSEFGKSFFAAEFFPEGICKRDDETGYIIPLPECEQEYKTRFKSFTDKLNILKSPGNTQLIKVYRTIREDKDNYICLYHMPESMPIKEYMTGNSGRRGYKQVYEMILPMSEALERLSNYKIYFKINTDNLYVNAFGSIEHAGFMAAEYDENFVAEDISSVLYYLITGKIYVETLAKPSETGASIPNSLDNLLYENLSYNVSHESLSAFLAKIKESILFDTDMATASKGVINNGRKLSGLAEAEAPRPVYETENLPVQIDYPPNIAPQQVSYPPDIAPAKIDYPPDIAPAQVSYPTDMSAMPVYIPAGKAEAPIQQSISEPDKGTAPTGGGKADGYPQPVYSTYGTPPYFPQAQPPQGGVQAKPTYSPKPPYNNAPKTEKKSRGGFLLGCALGCGGMFIVMFIILIIVIMALDESPSASASISEAISIEALPLEEFEQSYVFDEYEWPIFYATKTSYQNEEVSIEGTACIYNEHVYYRGYIEDMGWALVESPLDNPEMKNILHFTMAAYITAHDDYLYYSDVYDDYNIYSIYIGEDRDYEAVRLNDSRSIHIQADDDYIYYINLEDRQRVYAIDIETQESKVILNKSVNWIAECGDKLVYSAEDGLFTYNKDSGRNKKLINSDYIYIHGGIAQDGEYIYYSDVFEECIKRKNINAQTEPEKLIDTFTGAIAADGGYLYFINDDDYTLTRMNADTGEEENLNIDPENFIISGKYLMYLDYIEESQYILNMESWEITALFEGQPDYNMGF